MEEKPGWPGFRDARRPSCPARPIGRLETLKQPCVPPRLHPLRRSTLDRRSISVPRPTLRTPGEKHPPLLGGRERRARNALEHKLPPRTTASFSSSPARIVIRNTNRIFLFLNCFVREGKKKMEDRKIQNEDPSTSKLVSRVKWTTIPLEKCIIHGLTCALTTPHGVFQINASSHARPILGTSLSSMATTVNFPRRRGIYLRPRLEWEGLNFKQRNENFPRQGWPSLGRTAILLTDRAGS